MTDSPRREAARSAWARVRAVVLEGALPLLRLEVEHACRETGDVAPRRLGKFGKRLHEEAALASVPQLRVAASCMQRAADAGEFAAGPDAASFHKALAESHLRVWQSADDGVHGDRARLDAAAKAWEHALLHLENAAQTECWVALARTHIHRGAHAKAAQTLGTLIQMHGGSGPFDSPGFMLQVAMLHSALGDHEQAFGYLSYLTSGVAEAARQVGHGLPLDLPTLLFLTGREAMMWADALAEAAGASENVFMSTRSSSEAAAKRVLSEQYFTRAFDEMGGCLFFFDEESPNERDDDGALAPIRGMAAAVSAAASAVALRPSNERQDRFAAEFLERTFDRAAEEMAASAGAAASPARASRGALHRWIATAQTWRDVGDACVAAALPLFAADAFTQALAREFDGHSALGVSCSRVVELQVRLAHALWLGGRTADARRAIAAARENDLDDAHAARTALAWDAPPAPLKHDLDMPIATLIAPPPAMSAASSVDSASFAQADDLSQQGAPPADVEPGRWTSELGRGKVITGHDFVNTWLGACAHHFSLQSLVPQTDAPRRSRGETGEALTLAADTESHRLRTAARYDEYRERTHRPRMSLHKDLAKILSSGACLLVDTPASAPPPAVLHSIGTMEAPAPALEASAPPPQPSSIVCTEVLVTPRISEAPASTLVSPPPSPFEPLEDDPLVEPLQGDPFGPEADAALLNAFDSWRAGEAVASEPPCAPFASGDRVRAVYESDDELYEATVVAAHGDERGGFVIDLRYYNGVEWPRAPCDAVREVLRRSAIDDAAQPDAGCGEKVPALEPAPSAPAPEAVDPPAPAPEAVEVEIEPATPGETTTDVIAACDDAAALGPSIDNDREADSAKAADGEDDGCVDEAADDERIEAVESVVESVASTPSGRKRPVSAPSGRRAPTGSEDASIQSPAVQAESSIQSIQSSGDPASPSRARPVSAPQSRGGHVRSVAALARQHKAARHPFRPRRPRPASAPTGRETDEVKKQTSWCLKASVPKRTVAVFAGDDNRFFASSAVFARDNDGQLKMSVVEEDLAWDGKKWQEAAQVTSQPGVVRAAASSTKPPTQRPASAPVGRGGPMAQAQHQHRAAQRKRPSSAKEQSDWCLQNSVPRPYSGVDDPAQVEFVRNHRSGKMEKRVAWLGREDNRPPFGREDKRWRPSSATKAALYERPSEAKLLAEWSAAAAAKPSQKLKEWCDRMSVPKAYVEGCRDGSEVTFERSESGELTRSVAWKAGWPKTPGGQAAQPWQMHSGGERSLCPAPKRPPRPPAKPRPEVAE